MYEGHIDLLKIATYSPPMDEPEPVNRGILFRLPGRGQVGTEDSIIPKGNFTWGEATKNGTRIPVNELIVNNIIAMARQMEEVRERLGNIIKQQVPWVGKWPETPIWSTLHAYAARPN